ncbi:sulfotransferase [Azohydromonas sp. G-1-1-14]|uniref:Sulfotransferase n=1 Tax=Azohydromonas caseinilytica TaxID=2728836 RepID=A0A848FI50_9BURK|nr:sulfotransferase [Azohydromonas caseinilytica]
MTDMFLGGHPQATSLGEINFLAKAIKVGERCSCGALVRDCPQWEAVYGRLGRWGFDLQDPYRFRLWDAVAWTYIDSAHQTQAFLAAVKLRKAWMAARDLVPPPARALCPVPPAYRQALANKMRLYEAVAQAWDKQLVIDSSKNVREAVELYQRHPDTVRILLVTRDGRGVYLSRRSSGRDREESVKGWLSYYARALVLLERHVPPAARMQLKYEDIAGDPEAAGRTLCDFVGLQFQPSMLQLDGVVRHMVNGNATRFAPGKGIALDERWRRDLAPGELSFFDGRGGRMNAALGYR